jgi:hypothetical protein
MNRIRFGLIAGLAFGILDILPMFAMELPDRTLAIAGAFVSRFAIGFLIPNVSLPTTGVIRGLIVSVLVSLPDAIITRAYGPIMGFGIAGGIIIGYLAERSEKKHGNI